MPEDLSYFSPMIVGDLMKKIERERGKREESQRGVVFTPTMGDTLVQVVENHFKTYMKNPMAKPEDKMKALAAEKLEKAFARGDMVVSRNELEQRIDSEWALLKNS